MTFELLALRFSFRTIDDLWFPPGKASNIFRGALGDQLRRIACRPECPGAKECRWRTECAYARLFEPALETGPSGLADPPRPFVLRPGFIEGRATGRGAVLPLDVHLFDPRAPFLPHLIAALRGMGDSGFGPARGRAGLERVDSLDEHRRPATAVYRDRRLLIDAMPEPMRISLDPEVPQTVRRLRICFLTPTELKVEGRVASALDFAVLIARLRDRVAALDSLYGRGTVAFDWNALAASARGVRTAASSLREEHVERRSSRTGQVHPLGGVTGTVDYEGNMTPFLPLLQAGQWTGVGRQTVWGKGAYQLTALE